MAKQESVFSLKILCISFRGSAWLGFIGENIGRSRDDAMSAGNQWERFRPWEPHWLNERVDVSHWLAIENVFVPRILLILNQWERFRPWEQCSIIEICFRGVKLEYPLVFLIYTLLSLEICLHRRWNNTGSYTGRILLFKNPKSETIWIFLKYGVG